MNADKMHFTYYFLILIKLVIANERIVCNGVMFNDEYYDKILLVKNYGRPCNLVMHKYSGILFFSHTVQNGSTVDFAITACHLEDNQCNDVQGIPGGYAVAYDHGNDDIYFGGHDGIYKYNFLSGSAEFFAEQGKSIWDIHIRRNFYYVEYPTQKLFVYKNEYFTQVAEATKIEVDRFYVSKRNDIYFSNKTALYKVERSQRDAVLLNDDVVVRQIAEDTYGDIYFSTTDGIYLEQKPYLILKKVVYLNNLYGLTFGESDQIIFSNENAIYKLVASRNKDICYKLLRRNLASN